MIGKGTGRSDCRKPLRRLAVLGCFSLLSCAWTAAPKTMTLDQSANQTEVSLSQGQGIEIVLPENPTTGFRWEVVHPGTPVLAPDGSTFDAPAGAPGKGGVRHWRFHAVQAGSGTLEMIYRRSFEPAKPPAQTFLIHIRVVK